MYETGKSRYRCSATSGVVVFAGNNNHDNRVLIFRRMDEAPKRQRWWLTNELFLCCYLLPFLNFLIGWISWNIVLLSQFLIKLWKCCISNFYMTLTLAVSLIVQEAMCSRIIISFDQLKEKSIPNMLPIIWQLI